MSEPSVRYLVQCEEGLPDLYACLRDRCTVLSYRAAHGDSDIFLPDSTWTTGRNALHAFHRQAGDRHDYYVFLDADISFQGLSQREGFARFEIALAELGAPIVVPTMWTYNAQTGGVHGFPVSARKKGMQRDGLATQPVDWFDGAMNAFRSDVFEDDRMLPYDCSFDSRSWWASQFIMILRANVRHRDRIVQLNDLLVANTRNDRANGYVPGYDGFAEAYEKVRQSFGLDEIEMTSEEALPPSVSPRAVEPGAAARWSTPMIVSGQRRVTRPHLSIVVVGRNDSYGGDFLHRLRCCIAQLCAQLSVRSTFVELLVVEWNPPPERPSLHTCVQDLVPPQNLSINVLTVPAAVHDRLEGADRSPLFEYRGKNAGVRRARGRFILCMNPDLLLADELLDHICGERLRADGFYRADKHEFDAPLTVEAAGPENLRTAEASVSSAIIYGQRERIRHDVHSDGTPYTHASGDFWLAHRSIWKRLGGYAEGSANTHVDALLCFEAIHKGVRQHVLPSAMKLYHMNHSREDRVGRPGVDINRWREIVGADEFQRRDDWGLAGDDLVCRPVG
ncbi:MAG: hypothetical protein AAGE01_08965 [Pseudomonadota bacterium]